MNFVSFSPHFPPNYVPFCVELRRKGVNVLGLADANYNELAPALRSALTEYYRVASMHNYDELVRALGYFTHQYGKLDRLESHNEYWLETDARLRDDFNIPGLRSDQMAPIKRKSEMKEMYARAGIPAARGCLATTLEEASNLAAEVGYPLVAKPDIGVGANKTYRLENRASLEAFFATTPPGEYILEEFIAGTIQTFDGLVDRDGKIVFSASLQYSDGMMELVNEARDFWYWTQREIPTDLEEAGRQLVDLYQLRERFFHFEFFRTADHQVVGLEVNMRPPGGMTTDIWNYANNLDIYREYANVVVDNRFEARVTRPYFCSYIGRRRAKIYRHTTDEIRAAFPKQLMHDEPISGIFASAIGDYGYVIRSPKFDEIKAIAAYILEKG